jgi:hypothetical protein
MLKRDYFLGALRTGAFKNKAWVLHAFSETRLTEKDNFDFRLYKGKKHYYWLHKEPDTGFINEVILEDTNIAKPPFHFREPIELKAGEVPNLSYDHTTNYGRLLVNWIALVYPLGAKIPFVEGEFNLKVVESQIEKRLTTNPEWHTPDTFVSPNPIYVSEFLKYIDALLFLEGFAQLCVPTATPKSLTTDPQVAIRRKELLEEYKGRLNDPVVVAKIEAELVEMDKAWIKGDLSEGFYQKNSMYESSRKKMHIMQGYSSGFGLEPTTTTTPLMDGWDSEQLPGMINSLREGAYGRGKMTALGGAATKTVNRMFQNVSLIKTDCGTILGWKRIITAETVKKYIGFYYLGAKGITHLYTDEIAKTAEGKTFTFRSPQFCKAPGVLFCRYCVGDINAENENALSATVAAMTSQLLQIQLSSAHAVTLKATRYLPEHAID